MSDNIIRGEKYRYYKKNEEITHYIIEQERRITIIKRESIEPKKASDFENLNE